MNQSHVDAINYEAKIYNDTLLKVFAALAKYGDFEQTGEKIPEDKFDTELREIFGKHNVGSFYGSIYIHYNTGLAREYIHIRCFQSPNLERIKLRHPLRKADWTIESLSAFIGQYEEANKLANKMREEVKNYQKIIFGVDKIAQDSIKIP